MKLLPAAALATAVFASSAWCVEPTTAAALFGVWAVDTSRLPVVPQARPKSVTISFSDEGGGRLRAKVEVVDPSGALLQAEGVTPLDGTPTPVQANFESDTSATAMPRPEVLIMQLAKGGKPASTRIYTVSEDGKQMIETVAYFGPDGQPVLRRNHFSRVR